MHRLLRCLLSSIAVATGSAWAEPAHYLVLEYADGDVVPVYYRQVERAADPRVAGLLAATCMRPRGLAAPRATEDAFRIADDGALRVLGEDLQTRATELNRLQSEAARQSESGLADALSRFNVALASDDLPAIRSAVKQVETAAAQVKSPDVGRTALKFTAPLQSKRTGTLDAVFSAANLQRATVLGVIYLVIAALACLVPARRAVSIDPLIAMRAE